eukprot:g1823.t1
MLKCYISPGPGAVTAIRSRSTDSEADISILEIDDVGSTASTTSSSQSQLLRIEQEHGSRVVDSLDVGSDDDELDELDELELQQKKDVDLEDQEDEREPSFVQEFEQESHSAAEQAVRSGTAHAQHAETSGRKASDCESSQYNVTCSSERHRADDGTELPLIKRGCANIIDCNYGTFGQTGDRRSAIPADDVAQLCPWVQIDLGQEMHVSSVSVVVPSHPKHLRRLFFTEAFVAGQTQVGSNAAPDWHNIHPPNDGANFPESPQNTTASDDGFRVIVAKVWREQSHQPRVDVRCGRSGKTGRYVVIDQPGGSVVPPTLKLRSLHIGEVEIQARPRMDVTCSSEVNGDSRACANILDGDYTTFGNTGAHAAGQVEGATPNEGRTVGQKCPWYQIDLGREMRVNAVAIVVPDEPGRMRRLLFTQPSRAEIQPSLPIAYDNRGPFPSNDTDDMGGAFYAGEGSAYYEGSFAESDQNTDSVDDGFRVSVTKEARVGTSVNFNSTCTERDDPNGNPFCAGTGVGNACPTNWRQQMAECETVRFGKNDRAPGAEFAATYHSRFHAEHPAAKVAARRVAVRCEKTGRYIVIDAPGIKENDPDPTHLRALAISEVEVFTPEERYAATEWDLTPTDADRVTCSSEARANRACSRAIDNDQNTPGTEPAASTGQGRSGSSAQMCPWLQVDLGEEKEISQVHLTFPGNYKYLRWLFFTTAGEVAGSWDDGVAGVLNTAGWATYANNANYINYPEHRQNDARDAGFRVLVLKDALPNGNTCSNTAGGGGTYCHGNAAGPVCRVHYDERFQLCEIVKYGKDKGGEEFARRFRKTESQQGTTFTVTVACNRKRGRYVVVDLPGATAFGGSYELWMW